MIVVTGAAGFIGSNLVKKLNTKGIDDIWLVDDFSNEIKNKNLDNKTYKGKEHRDFFFEWIKNNTSNIDYIFHIGARTDTTEFDINIFNMLNLGYSKKIWQVCTEFEIPLLYASSAATYGLGELGYNDSHDIIDKLKPLNPYGNSKNEFDKWVLQQTKSPPYWHGVKFFNVYGPNEYHKGRMASVIFHAFNQIRETKKMKLFRSHRPDYEDGEQKRDFIYVKDAVDVMFFLMNCRINSGIYNLGTGKARTFLDLTSNTFQAMGLPENIEFIDTPEDIRDKYQYFTEANMEKLRSIGYKREFISLEDGLTQYIHNYLIPQKFN